MCDIFQILFWDDQYDLLLIWSAHISHPYRLLEISWDTPWKHETLTFGMWLVHWFTQTAWPDMHICPILLQMQFCTDLRVLWLIGYSQKIRRESCTLFFQLLVLYMMSNWKRIIVSNGGYINFFQVYTNSQLTILFRNYHNWWYPINMLNFVR